MRTFTPAELKEIALIDKYILCGPLTKDEMRSVKDIEREVRALRTDLGLEKRGHHGKGRRS